MRPTLDIIVRVEWQDLDHARVLSIVRDGFDRVNEYEEMAYDAVDDKFNSL